ncbi:MAG: 3-deoxy-7-phosphoheptulonate synthase [Spirochaetales bacterium]|nr:3-deoxy-7-phosphoheptulonate synthase [Spirochaetales bacterium]
MYTQWKPDSWRSKPAAHQVEYMDKVKYRSVLDSLMLQPPLVFPGEIHKLTRQIAEAGSGERFIIHGGDCVERFQDCNEETITNKIKIILQMSTILTHALRKPVLRLGRIGGQYFKPRSSERESLNGREVMTYRGDTVNGFPEELRAPDADRLTRGYYCAAATLNYIRAMISGGFTDLHHPYNWNLHSIGKTEEWAEYSRIVEQILDAIHFMESIGGMEAVGLNRIEFYTSHEGLHLGFEEALTRKERESDSYYNAGAHMLWIGERTRDLKGAHLEYFRGIINPIGIKISSRIDPDELNELIHILNPDNTPGRLTLITRLGIDKVEESLPRLIRKVLDGGHKVTWSCDPMHGNTVSTGEGVKTRRFDDILGEIKASHRIHSEIGSSFGGVHFELTGEEVTECTGGAVKIMDSDLSTNYQSFCDPRLNYAQSMEIAFMLSRLMKA